ncbi:MAG: cytoplasmic protein [Actinobacteria bacterium]|nr:MAG: cytoplasmic protein [Actinomycetota bacterium]
MHVLIAGETWMTHKVEVKGFSTYATGSYAVGLTELVDGLRAHGHEVTHVTNHDAVENFPCTLADFEPFDVVVLSDISADTIQLHPACTERGERTPDRLRVLSEHVRRGHGLLMVGGYMSFSGFEGKARYQSTPLASVLPVELLGHDDRVEAPEGVTPKVRTSHAVLDGIAVDWPYFLGYNQLIAKGEAEVVMTADDDPFLVLGVAGEGRVAAFASDCSPHWGSPDFLAWPDYERFWSQLVTWLGGR